MPKRFDPTVRYWSHEYQSIKSLLEKIHDQELALPQFQRDFTWGRDDWENFLYSILRNQFSGSLLLMQVKGGATEFAPREVDRGPKIVKARLEALILDGQQRTTTLYQAFQVGFKFRKKCRYPRINIDALLAADDFEIEHLDMLGENDLTPEEQADRGELQLNTVYGRDQRVRWEVKYGKVKGIGLPDLQARLGERIARYSDVGGYEFPALTIKKDAPSKIVVDIFQDLNRRGRRLDAFELMVARCFNEKEADGKPYDLKKHWETAYASAPTLKSIGISEDRGLFPLTLLALAVKRNTRYLKKVPLGAEAVLATPPRFITGTELRGHEISIEKAVDALEKAAKFLWECCGVISSILLPQESMLLPLAEQFLIDPTGKKLSEESLRKWFWVNGLLGEFYGSTMSYVFKSSQNLSHWADDETSNTPDEITKFTKASVDQLNLQAAKARQDDIRGKTILAMLVAEGARDWIGKNGLLKGYVERNDEPVEAHHVIAKKTLRKTIYMCKENDERLIPIALFAPASKNANATLGDKSQAQVKSGFLKGKTTTILKSAHVPEQDWLDVQDTKKSLDKFLIAREKQLKKFIKTTLGL